jgi:lipopolysaccharide export system protein LptA
MTGTRYFKKLIGLLLFIAVSNPFSNLDAKDSVDKKVKLDKNQPIQIVSDRLDAFNDRKLVIFSGNAVAIQGDKTIKSDRILLHYRKNIADNKKAGQSDIGEAGDLEKIEAKGSVTITQGERTVTGDDAVFFQDAQKIIMTGNAVMREGQNIIRGDKIIVFLNEDRGVVESDENKRVKATIYPDEKKSGSR